MPTTARRAASRAALVAWMRVLNASPELDEAEQQEDQQGKEQRELDRGRAVLSLLRHHRAGSAGGAQSSGCGPLATQSPTIPYRSLTVLNRA